MLYCIKTDCEHCEQETEVGVGLEDVKGFLDNAEYDDKLAVLYAAAESLGVELEIENER